MYGECVGGERGWGVMCVGSVWVGCDVCGEYGGGVMLNVVRM